MSPTSNRRCACSSWREMASRAEVAEARLSLAASTLKYAVATRMSSCCFCSFVVGRGAHDALVCLLELCVLGPVEDRLCEAHAPAVGIRIEDRSVTQSRRRRKREDLSCPGDCWKCCCRASRSAEDWRAPAASPPPARDTGLRLRESSGRSAQRADRFREGFQPRTRVEPNKTASARIASVRVFGIMCSLSSLSCVEFSCLSSEVLADLSPLTKRRYRL